MSYTADIVLSRPVAVWMRSSGTAVAMHVCDDPIDDTRIHLHLYGPKGGHRGYITIPKSDIPELITALNRMICGPLGQMVLDKEQNHGS